LPPIFPTPAETLARIGFREKIGGGKKKNGKIW